MTHDLAPARRVLDRVLVSALWLHVPMIALVAWQLNGPVIALAGTAATLAAAVTFLWFTMANATRRPSAWFRCWSLLHEGVSGRSTCICIISPCSRSSPRIATGL